MAEKRWQKRETSLSSTEWCSPHDRRYESMMPLKIAFKRIILSHLEGSTYKEEDSGVIAKRVKVALSGKVGFASATPATAPPSMVVEMTCSAAMTPAVASMI